MINQSRTPALHPTNRDRIIGTHNYCVDRFLRDGRCRFRGTNRAPPQTTEA